MVPDFFLPVPELSTEVKEVLIGSTAVLKCNSNDDRHNFFLWQVGQNKVIGPDNEYDPSKYKYEVLSGRLFIKKVTSDETGYYRCLSRDINSGNFNIGAVEMIVRDNPTLAESSDSFAETIKAILIVASLVVLIICAILFYRMRKDDKKQRNARLAMMAEDDDEEGSGDEIYNRTTTVINDTVPGPSTRNTEHITGIDNEGLDTNFNAAFEQISIKPSANRNLV